MLEPKVAICGFACALHLGNFLFKHGFSFRYELTFDTVISFYSGLVL